MTTQDPPAYSPLDQQESDKISFGSIEIGSEVIASIAAQAAQKIDGIIVVNSTFGLSEIFGSKESAKGVDVKLDGESGHVQIHVDVNVRYGVPIYQAAHDLQVLIKEEVEAMTGSMNVDKVNVRVKRLVMQDEKVGDRGVITPDLAVESREDTKMLEEK